jgi:hypothetical protein
MKKLFLRGLFPLLLLWIVVLSAFLPHPRANAVFSRVKIPHAIQPTAQTAILATAQTNPQPLVPLTGDYACILSDDVFFYTATDGRKGLFLLPKSYYVRLLEYRYDYCKVEYQTDISAKRLVGYVATDKLTFVDYIPSRPYLYYVFDLRYTIENASTDSQFLTEITVSCIYYGDYVIGSERYCYVLRGDEFGYVPKPATLSYEENEEYADYVASLQPDSTPTPDTVPPSAKENSPAQIAILVVICLLVPILAALILKPPRRAPYEDDPS